MNDKKLYQVALCLIPGIGSILTKQLVSYCGSAESVFKSSRNKLGKIPGIGQILVNNILAKRILIEAENEILYANNNNIRILFYTDKDYPINLKQICDAPPLIYSKGNIDLNSSKIIGIVGTRKATHYGKEVVERFINDVKIFNPVIISGLAYGIDISAHKAALDNGLSTIGVMASGMGTIYPSVHTKIANEMVQNHGGLMTEYRSDTQADPRYFPARNRIIAGLSDVLLVAEAANKGGALITANIAHSYDKDIFAVPGNLDRRYSEGCNQLIRDHKANIYTDIENFENIMGWENKKKPDNTHGRLVTQFEQNICDCTAEEKKILEILEKDGKEVLIDQLSWKSQIAINQMASILLNLEFKGLIRSLPGKKYKLNRSWR